MKFDQSLFRFQNKIHLTNLFVVNVVVENTAEVSSDSVTSLMVYSSFGSCEQKRSEETDAKAYCLLMRLWPFFGRF